MSFSSMDAIEPFTVGRSVVLKHIMTTPALSWPVWIALAIGLILTVAGFFFDIRLIALGLMMSAVVVPLMLALIYFYHSLSPAVVPNLLPHTLERRHDGYILHIWRRHESDEAPQDEQALTESDTIRLFDSNIVTKKSTFEYDMFFFKDSRMNILYVPRY